MRGRHYYHLPRVFSNYFDRQVNNRVSAGKLIRNESMNSCNWKFRNGKNIHDGITLRISGCYAKSGKFGRKAIFFVAVMQCLWIHIILYVNFYIYIYICGRFANSLQCLLAYEALGFLWEYISGGQKHKTN